MEFVAIDFETANPDFSSICQVGIAHFKGRSIQQEWMTYVDPEDYFDEMNVLIHGIDEKTVQGSPTFKDIMPELYAFINGKIVVCHTHFDRTAIKKACAKNGIPLPECSWLDTACVTRRAWQELASRGYALRNICSIIGYDFKNHDALEDAKAAAHVLLAAMDKTGLDLQGWIKRVRYPIGSALPNSKHAQDGNMEGSFYGELIVFTGSLSLPRRDAAQMAAEVGFTVADGVNKNTTVLVVGDQDIRKLAGHKVSNKQMKAEDLIRKGQKIRIIKESDFIELINIKP